MIFLRDSSLSAASTSSSSSTHANGRTKSASTSFVFGPAAWRKRSRILEDWVRTVREAYFVRCTPCDVAIRPVVGNHTHKEDSWNNGRVRCVSVPADFGPKLLFPILLGLNFGFTLEGETGIQLWRKVGLDIEEIMRLEGCASAIEKLWTTSTPSL